MEDWGKPKVPAFWGIPLSHEAPPRPFQPPKCKLTPSTMHIGEGRFLCNSIQKLQIGGRQSLFGGCPFAFWRAPISILEAEIVLGGALWMRLFAYNSKLPAYSGAFYLQLTILALLLTIDNCSFFTYNWSLFACSFFTYNWSFFAYSGKVRLIRASRDCKQRSLTLSKKNSNCK